MSTDANPGLPIGGLASLSAQPDSLRAEQDPEYLSKALRSAFTEREPYEIYLSSIVHDEARVKVLLEVFDKALTAPQNDIKIFEMFRDLCGRAGVLPASHLITEGIIKMTEDPVASGDFSDVWEGISNGNLVAIRALRVCDNEDLQQVREDFCREVAVWRWISHPNIVPFLGVLSDPLPSSMVSEWMPNGNVRDYVRSNPEVGRVQLLLDISRGLSFLHSLEIVGGELNGGNILVDKSGRARLNNFRFTGIAGLHCTKSSASVSRGKYRWMAPELLAAEQVHATSQSDVFATGMVAIEIFTGEVPFPEIRELAAIREIMDGKRPPRPPNAANLGLSDELWAVIQCLWAHEAGDRPPVSTFADLLGRATPDALLEGLIEFDVNSEQHITSLQSLMDYGDNLLFGMGESLVLIDVFDRVLKSSIDDGNIRSHCLRGLQEASAMHGILPKSYWIPQSSLADPDMAFSATGRVSSTYKRSMGGELVAVKTISSGWAESSHEFKQRLCAGAVRWKQVQWHPNVVGFLGVVSDSPLFPLVYTWMPNGTLSEYLHEHSDADQLSLLSDVARGLACLHENRLVYGALTGHNILVDADGNARISGYGLVGVLSGGVYHKKILSGVRWMAPENILNTREKKKVTVRDGKRADIYSLAMVMFEALTGTAPFLDARDDDILDGVLTGLRPKRPSENAPHALVDALWTCIQACWSPDPEKRPTALEVLQSLQVVAQSRAQGRSQETQELDDVTQNYTEGAPGLALKPLKEQKERNNLLGRTLMSRSIGRFFAFPRNGSGSTSKRARENPSQSTVSNLHDTGEGSSGLGLMDLSKEMHLERTSERGPPGTKGRTPRGPSQPEFPAGAKGILEALSDPDLFPPEPSIYNVDSGPSIWSPGNSVEIPAVLTSHGAMDPDEFLPSTNPPPLKLEEINAECQENRAQELIDRLDATLDHATSDQERHELLNALCKMCSRRRMLPKSMRVVGRPTGELVEADRGGHTVIFRAQHNNRTVAIKTIRVTMTSDFEKCHSEFCREAVAWRHLRHPNILPLLGVDLEQNRLSMISAWMDQGNINEYVKRQGGGNRLQLLADAAAGLEYMHGLNMVHGDLKGANILINQNHHACLADFGLSTIVSVGHNTGDNASLISVASRASLMSFTAGGTPRWMSPELLDPERFGASDDRPTKKSDCYALGMVVYEVLSGNSPYLEITNEGLLIYTIMEGYRPRKPDAAGSLGFTNELWKIVQRCWLADASERPDVRIILYHLSNAAWSWESRW